MLTLRAPTWPRRKTSPSAAKENRSEGSDDKNKKLLSPPAPAEEPEPVPNGRFGANRRIRKRRSGSLSPMKADGTPRPSSQEDLTRPASAPDLASPAPAPAAETTPARPPSKFDSGNFSFHKSPEPEAPPPPPPLDTNGRLKFEFHTGARSTSRARRPTTCWRRRRSGASR